MLNELERKLTALIGDSLAERPHLRVVQAPASALPAEAGAAVVRVGLDTVSPELSFERDQIAFGGSLDAPTSRRVLPLRFTARVEFAQQAADDTPAAVSVGRSLLLEDMSLVSHALGAASVRSGQDFQTAAADPGFRVLLFDLERGLVAPDTLHGELHYSGAAEVWPPMLAGPEGIIRVPDVLLGTLPVRIDVDAPLVTSGATTQVRVSGLSGSRLVDPVSHARESPGLALLVLSDLPPAERGSVLSGVAGASADVRIVPVTQPQTVITYQAPTGALGATRREYVAVHLATPDRRSGSFLGSAAINLTPGNA